MSDGRVIKEVFVNGKKVTIDEAELLKMTDTEIDHMVFPSIFNRAKFMTSVDSETGLSTMDGFEEVRRQMMAKYNMHLIPSQEPKKQAVQVKEPQVAQNKITETKETPSIDDNTLRRASKITVDLLNKFRKEQKLNQVVDNDEIYNQCQIHSQFQADNSKLTHDGFSQRVSNLRFKTTTSAENVAFFSMPISTPDEIAAQFMDQWKKSPGHRANMVNEVVNTASVGIAKKGKAFYATMILVKKA